MPLLLSSLNTEVHLESQNIASESVDFKLLGIVSVAKLDHVRSCTKQYLVKPTVPKLYHSKIL